MDSVLGLVRHAGNEGLFRAIELSLLAAAAGHPLHLHAEGLRGTGKTTVMRAARRLLPRIRRIKDCLYNCDPENPHCPHHRALSPDELAQLGDEWVPMPFLEISHSAKVGTVVGSIDLGRLVNPTRPEAALLPGTVPQAHRGIIFVDEINRLAETAPELADVLLDVMGTKPGRIQIEETGLPAVELPVQVTVWAASNPDEDPGPLEEVRRQLSDRFDFAVYADRPTEAAAVERILALGQEPAWHRPLTQQDETAAELYRAGLLAHAAGLDRVTMPGPVRQQIADLYSRFGVESLRAVQAIQLGMRLTAALEQRGEARADDLGQIVPLALRHRLDSDGMKKVTAHLSACLAKTEQVAPPPQPVKRFPSISFGGAAVVEGATEVRGDRTADGTKGTATARPDLAGPETGVRAISSSAESADSLPQATATARRPEWNTQHPPRPQVEQPGWLRRTVDGVRRKLANRPGGEPGGNGDGPGSRSAPAPVEPTMLDPLTTPLVAPPNLARVIARIDPADLVRSEEELFH